MKTYILKTLVGSQAHGLAGQDSDYDYRGVYVVPTKDILSLGFQYKGSSWLEGEKEDATAWEIGHFLQLATKCNPTILETFVAPVMNPFEPKSSYTPASEEWNNDKLAYCGQQLRELFPYLWNPHDAFNAFVGYGLNQRKKMLDNHLDRWHKYGVAYIRTLINLCDLLHTGMFSLLVEDEDIKSYLIQVKNKEIKPGEIIDKADILTTMAKGYRDTCKHTPDLNKVNEFLIKIRKEFWE